MFQVVGSASQITEALAAWTAPGSAAREAEARTRGAPRPSGRSRLRVSRARERSSTTRQPVLTTSVRLAARNGDRLCGPSGSGKSTIISLIAAFHEPVQGAVAWMERPVHGPAGAYRTQLRGAAGHVPVRRPIRENVAFARLGASEEQVWRPAASRAVDEFAESWRKGTRPSSASAA